VEFKLKVAFCPEQTVVDVGWVVMAAGEETSNWAVLEKTEGGQTDELTIHLK
jgi:hypothetical protein